MLTFQTLIYFFQLLLTLSFLCLHMLTFAGRFSPTPARSTRTSTSWLSSSWMFAICGRRSFPSTNFMQPHPATNPNPPLPAPPDPLPLPPPHPPLLFLSPKAPSRRSLLSNPSRRPVSSLPAKKRNANWSLTGECRRPRIARHSHRMASSLAGSWPARYTLSTLC